MFSDEVKCLRLIRDKADKSIGIFVDRDYSKINIIIKRQIRKDQRNNISSKLLKTTRTFKYLNQTN